MPLVGIKSQRDEGLGGRHHPVAQTARMDKMAGHEFLEQSSSRTYA